MSSDLRDVVLDARDRVSSITIVGSVLTLVYIGFSAAFIVAGQQDTSTDCSPWLTGYGVALAVTACLMMTGLTGCRLLFADDISLERATNVVATKSSADWIGYGIRCPLSLWSLANLVFFIAFIALLVADECIALQNDWMIVGTVFSVILCFIVCVAGCISIVYVSRRREKLDAKPEDVIERVVGDGSLDLAF